MMKQKLLAVLCCVGAYVLSAQEHRLAVSASGVIPCKNFNDIKFATANSMSEFFEGERGRDRRCEEPDPEYPGRGWKRYLLPVVALNQIQADELKVLPLNLVGIIEKFVGTIYLHKELPKATLRQLQADAFRGLPALPLDLVGIIEDFAPSFKLTDVLPSDRSIIMNSLVFYSAGYTIDLIHWVPTGLAIKFALGYTLESLLLEIAVLWKKKGIARNFLGQQCASVHQYILNRCIDHVSPVTVRFNEDGVVTESDSLSVNYVSGGLFSTFSISIGSGKKTKIIKNRVARVLGSQNCATFPLPDGSTFLESVPESLRSNINDRHTKSVAVLNTSNTSEVAIGYKNGEVRVFLRDDWLKNFIKSPENFYTQEKLRQETINRARRKSWLRYLAFTSISVAATIVTLISIIRVNDYIAGGFSRCIAAFLRNR